MRAQEQSAAARTRPPVDLETRATDDHHQALRLWLRLLACSSKVAAEVRRQLRTQFETTLPRFDLMAQLERHPSGLKMNELSQRLMVSGGNVTGITDQLEREGLVVREDDPRDRRAYSVRLTPAGRALFDRMAQAHEGWIIGLFAGLNQSEKREMYRLLAKLKTHLTQAEPSKQAPGRRK